MMGRISKRPWGVLGKRAPADRPDQLEAKPRLLLKLSERLGAELTQMRFETGDYDCEVDGFCADPPLLLETSAHTGELEPAQVHKVMSDALKLLFVRRAFLPRARCILAFADEAAAKPFQESSWMAEALHKFEVEVLVVPLSD